MVTHRPRVAVLDDDIRFIRLVERILGTEDIEIQPVTTLDIEEARRVIAESGCQAAIVDVYMYGDASGFRLVERLRRDPDLSELPIIVASGARREIGRHVGFLQAHRCTVLLKPFGADELIAKVHSIEGFGAAAAQGTPAETVSGATETATRAIES